MEEGLLTPKPIVMTVVAMLFLAGISPIAGAQAASLVVAASSGRSYQAGEGGRWNAVFSGRHLLEDRVIMTMAAASVDITVGTLRLTVAPLSVFGAAASKGPGGRQDIALKAVAGSFRIVQPASDPGICTIEVPFGIVRASGADFTLDGNRLSVWRGAVNVANDAGFRRTVLARETLSIFPGAPLGQPSIGSPPRSTRHDEGSLPQGPAS